MKLTPAIILAAGGSTRLGRPKQLEPLDGEPLLMRATHVAQEAGCKSIVVLGCAADRIRAACKLDEAEIVLNPDWSSGMASSLRAGINALPPDTPGVLVMTCDQPAVTSAHVRALLEAGTRQEIVVASSYAGKRGVPAYFPNTSFPALLRLEGDSGARGLLASAFALVLPGGELDVDTEATLEEARRSHQIIR